MTHKIAFIPHKTRGEDIIGYLKIINGPLNPSEFKGDEDIDGAFYVKDEKVPHSRRTTPIITIGAIDYLKNNNYDIYTIEEYEKCRWTYQRYIHPLWDYYPQYDLEKLLSDDNDKKLNYIRNSNQIVLTNDGIIKKYTN